MRLCSKPKLHPIAPTPVWKRDELARIWLTPDDVAQLVMARQQVLAALLKRETCCDQMLLTRLSLEEIRSRFARVTSQLPVHAVDWLVQPILVTADERYLLKAVIHDSEVLMAYRMLPGREPDPQLVHEFLLLTQIRSKLYRADQIPS